MSWWFLMMHHHHVRRGKRPGWFASTTTAADNTISGIVPMIIIGRDDVRVVATTIGGGCGIVKREKKSSIGRYRRGGDIDVAQSTRGPPRRRPVVGCGSRSYRRHGDCSIVGRRGGYCRNGLKQLKDSHYG
jgi:hypothetical protein